MLQLRTEDAVAIAAINAIQSGDIVALEGLLKKTPALATAYIGSLAPGGSARALLHIVTDWPGHFQNGAATVKLLVKAGADVNAKFVGRHTETPLHWAASSNDVSVLDALLDAGANIEAPGAVNGGGTPLADARDFGQWKAAYQLVARGARTTLADEATLGLMDRLEQRFLNATLPTVPEINRAFWGACHGGQSAAAALLLTHGADINWLPEWERVSPLDAAERSEAGSLVAWLRSMGGHSANAVS